MLLQATPAYERILRIHGEIIDSNKVKIIQQQLLVLGMLRANLNLNLQILLLPLLQLHSIIPKEHSIKNVPLILVNRNPLVKSERSKKLLNK